MNRTLESSIGLHATFLTFSLPKIDDLGGQPIIYIASGSDDFLNTDIQLRPAKEVSSALRPHAAPDHMRPPRYKNRPCTTASPNIVGKREQYRFIFFKPGSSN